MTNGQLIIDNRRYIVVEESEYTRLLIASSGSAVNDNNLPPLPKPDKDGNVPAMQYARASLARKLILQRKSRHWSQATLAQKAGVRIETINRLEKAKHTADPATVRKLEKALSMRQVEA